MDNQRDESIGVKKVIYTLFLSDNNPQHQPTNFSILNTLLHKSVAMVQSVRFYLSYFFTSLHRLSICMAEGELSDIRYKIKLFKEKQLYFNMIIINPEYVLVIEQIFTDLAEQYNHLTTRKLMRRWRRQFKRTTAFYHQELEAISAYYQIY